MTHTAEEVRANVAENRRHMTTATEAQLTAYAALLEQREAGVTADIVKRAAQSLDDSMSRAGSSGSDDMDWDEFKDAVRIALLLVWPVAAEPVVQGEMSAEDRFEQYVQSAIDSSPEPLRRLGEFLANHLDDDKFPTAERLLLAIATQPRAVPVERVPDGWRPIETAPRDTCEVLVYAQDRYGASIDIDYRKDGVWVLRTERRENFIAAGGACTGGPDCMCTGPGEDAPYTHWMPIPDAPQPGEPNITQESQSNG